MSRKRGRSPSSRGNRSKKRRRNSPLTDTDDDGDIVPEEGLLRARQSLKDTERENLSLRKATLEKTTQKGLRSVQKEMKRRNETALARAMSFLIERVHFPLDYDGEMEFIDKYTGVKPRDKPNVCWDDKVSRSWLNRQRATVYAPTLFTTMLKFVKETAEAVAKLDPSQGTWLHKVVVRKLIPDMLGATYKPMSKQAAAKKLICANSVKEKKFLACLCAVLEWKKKSIGEKATLESLSQRAEQEYENLLKEHPGKSVDLVDVDTRRRRCLDEDATAPSVDTEDYFPSCSASSVSTRSSPPALSVFSHVAMDHNSSILQPPPTLSGMNASCLPIQTQNSPASSRSDLEHMSREALIEECLKLQRAFQKSEGLVQYFRERVTWQEKKIQEFYSPGRQDRNSRVAFPVPKGDAGGMNAGGYRALPLPCPIPSFNVSNFRVISQPTPSSFSLPAPPNGFQLAIAPEMPVIDSLSPDQMLSLRGVFE